MTGAGETTVQRAAGKRTQVEGIDGGDVHAAAQHGVKGSGGALPHAEAIQRSFGKHDISQIQAHVGGQAAEGAGAMGAEAYATGHQVAFAQAPSLHTAAHEAAHIVQQRAGVQLKGGVGAVGDPYEQHADAVADRVVAGQSAEALLDEMAGGKTSGSGGGGGAVQRKVGFELEVNWSVKRDATTPAEIATQTAESTAHAERREEVLDAAYASAKGVKDAELATVRRAYEATDKYKKYAAKGARGAEPTKGKMSESELRATYSTDEVRATRPGETMATAMPLHMQNFITPRPSRGIWPFKSKEPQYNVQRPNPAMYGVTRGPGLVRNQNDNAALEPFIPGINIAKGKSIMLGPDQPAPDAAAPGPAVEGGGPAPVEGAAPVAHEAAPVAHEAAPVAHEAAPVDGAAPPVAAAPAAAPVARNQLWDLTADQNSGVSQLEWVTKPLETRDQVDTAMTEITRMGTQLNTAARALPPGGAIDAATLATHGVSVAPEFAAAGLKIYPDAARTLRADPQVTGGFRLDQLLPLMEAMTGDTIATKQDGTGADNAPQSTSTYMNKQTDPEQTALALATTQARGAKARSPAGHPASDELVSLLALILNYLHVGNGAEKLANSKGIAAGFMARTDFAHNFTLLPLTEQTYFHGTPAALADLVGEISHLDMNGKVFAQGFQTAASRADEKIEYPLTRRTWVEGIATGTDLLRKSVDADVPDKDIRRDPVRKPFLDQGGVQQPDPVHFSLGRLKSVDDRVGPTNVKAAVVELRRMNGGVTVDNWKTFALNAFDLIQTVNHGGLAPAAPAAPAPAPAHDGPERT